MIFKNKLGNYKKMIANHRLKRILILISKMLRKIYEQETFCLFFKSYFKIPVRMSERFQYAALSNFGTSNQILESF